MDAAAIVACCSKAGLAVIRALGTRGIPVIGLGYGPNQPGLASRYLRERHLCPDPHEDEGGFIDCIKSLGSHSRGAVVFPTDDASLVALSRHKERLSSNLRVVAADWSIVRDLIEKHRTYAIAAQAGVPFPRLVAVSSADEARRAAAEIGYPCLLKPSTGHVFFKKLGCKMLKIDSAAELERGLERGLGYGGELMLCEFIPGDDTHGANYNSFAISGRPVAEFTAGKLRLRPTRIGFPTAVESRDIPEVTTLGRRMLEALGFQGFSCMEFKRDARDGRYRLMEVNARHNFSGALAVACGIEFPWYSYLAALGRPLPERAARATEGVCWIDDERDPRSIIGALRRGPRAAYAWFEPYRRRKVFALFAGADPAPFHRMLGERLHGSLARSSAAPNDGRLRKV